MNPTGEAALLRVYVSESDRYDGRPLYEAIVLKARELHLAGATVLRGVMGFGAHSRLHAAHLLRLDEQLPMVVEIVDVREKLDPIVSWLRETLDGGLITLERVETL